MCLGGQQNYQKVKPDGQINSQSMTNVVKWNMVNKLKGLRLSGVN